MMSPQPPLSPVENREALIERWRSCYATYLDATDETFRRATVQLSAVSRDIAIALSEAGKDVRAAQREAFRRGFRQALPDWVGEVIPPSEYLEPIAARTATTKEPHGQ